ncbi:SDR family oxidoreductase [Fontimonas sp. SYSU GA230001]|uniref:SDR family oxidoreductase n=1 Tax=Fontimonas sp. SYSU GA230001 TaxID=3142450 RepID=UPI0032B3F216
MSSPAIFVTGAAAGIGRATALLFASRGWRVGLYDIDHEAVERLRVELGANTVCGRLDVADAGAFAHALEDFVGFSGGRLDVLFNNAGILSVGEFETIGLARHHAIVEVNVKGVINGCHAAFPHLLRTPDSRVISMSSASAIYGAPSYATYAASKFAVKGLSEALDIEWQRHGIRVMDVLPLFVNTAMVTAIEQPASIARLGVRLQPGDIAQTVWDAAHWRGWRRVHWYPGLQTRLLALSNKLLPARLNRYATRKVSGY